LYSFHCIDSQAFSKLVNALFHMLRTLFKKGLNLEEYFRALDVQQKGILHRKVLLSTLRKIGLPFAAKDLQDVVQHYSQHASAPATTTTAATTVDFVDYVSFLKDARLLSKSSTTTGNGNGATSATAMMHQESTLGTHLQVLHEVRRLLLDSIKSLGKPPDDIYRSFARWDTQGTGTVTATQFLRVLARLHIDLSDQDQDFLVDLLDTNGMGRIDFESLLVFCFSGASSPAVEQDLFTQSSPLSPINNNSNNNGNSNQGMVGTAIGFDDNAGETLSAVSLENTSLTDLRSTHSSNLNHNQRRPHTASLYSRPFDSSSSNHQNNHNNNHNSNNNSNNSNYNNNGNNNRNAMDSFRERGSDGVREGSPHRDGLHRNRPLTASARVRVTENTHNNTISNSGNGNHGNSLVSLHLVSSSSPTDEYVHVEELPDDVLHGESLFDDPNHVPNRNRESNRLFPTQESEEEITQGSSSLPLVVVCVVTLCGLNYCFV
jgi:Ca2+-binding EF-hand superfamily protein